MTLRLTCKEKVDVDSLTFALTSCDCLNFIKEIKKLVPRALLSYISTWEFLRTLEKCREALAYGSCLSALLSCS